jgi:hypothetical protein
MVPTVSADHHCLDALSLVGYLLTLLLPTFSKRHLLLSKRLVDDWVPLLVISARPHQHPLRQHLAQLAQLLQENTLWPRLPSITRRMMCGLSLTVKSSMSPA